MKFSIKYSEKYEKYRVLDYTMPRLDRYSKAGYSVDLPEMINKKLLIINNNLYKTISTGYETVKPKKSLGNDFLTKIENEIVEEYKNREKDYKKIENDITKQMVDIQEKFSSTLLEVFGRDMISKLETINIQLTQYGTGGSYELPNKIIYNINNKRSYKTILHETIHLIIEPLVQKYKIEHQGKEYIVDSILNSKKFGFTNYNEWRKSSSARGNDGYGGVSAYMKDYFQDNFFGDIGGFFSGIEKARDSYKQPEEIRKYKLAS